MVCLIIVTILFVTSCLHISVLCKFNLCIFGFILYNSTMNAVSPRYQISITNQFLFQYRTYETLRREHDAQIIRIAMEAGLRITPETWSTQLYGNTNRKSEMQSIIDKVRKFFELHIFVAFVARTTLVLLGYNDLLCRIYFPKRLRFMCMYVIISYP